MTPPYRRILIADDHPLFRDALRRIVEDVCPFATVVEAGSYSECSSVARADASIDLAFVDLMMPCETESLEALACFRAEFPLATLVVVASRDDWPTVRRVMTYGVAAYVPKTASKIDVERAIRCVASGGDGRCDDALAPCTARDAHASDSLTPRQKAVLEQLARGSSNRQIARDLNIEEITVKVHISAILRKLHVKNRLEAVVTMRGFDLRDGP